MKTAELITELTEKYGVSGHESAVSDFAVEIISKYCDETNIDNMGNVIGKITGTSSENEEKQKIMIEAHMDQVGFLVSEITEDGEIKFVAVGGIDVRILPGLRVKINGNKQIPGVIMVPKAGTWYSDHFGRRFPSNDEWIEKSGFDFYKNFICTMKSSVL